MSGQHTTAGCLDLAIDRRPDLANGSVVVQYAFGNRCEHPTIVDLSTVAVIGRTADGHEVQLAAFDPRHEIAALRIDGCAVGHEAIAYPVDTPLADICVDAASIAHADAAQWFCFPSQTRQSEEP